MIFFFGTRPGKTEIKTLAGAPCPYCEQTGTLTASKTSNWFHFFWIKLFKISNNTIAECSHCKRAYFKEEFSEEMRRAFNEGPIEIL
ncbi:MAG: zinc-ribbon domain-containing protein [Aurantibacter sp.]